MLASSIGHSWQQFIATAKSPRHFWYGRLGFHVRGEEWRHTIELLRGANTTTQRLKRESR